MSDRPQAREPPPIFYIVVKKNNKISFVKVLKLFVVNKIDVIGVEKLV